ncbi:hypothetical protein mRhiFer1_009169 [Rhinolophus ferrumequinum]|uniref:Uncharacterized protein n=1 Tax=Rhinolophus ferrumequinum TaxID=59479 RepID=A0A7J7SJK5_RHIFE|nr:hypothetical protein mRhiFer1_009169 [Rhinolophus ferrumequinum]
MWMCTSLLNHHFLWFLFCFGFAQILAKMRLFVSSCREGLWLSFLLVLGLLLLPGEPKRRGGLPLSPQLSLGVAVGLSPLQPQAAHRLVPAEALAPGLEGRQPPASRHRSLGLGTGKEGLILFFWGERGVSC